MPKQRVLVAENHEEMRWAIIELLHKPFQVVAAVCDGEELVQAANCLLPDVIVSDIFMPRMDGPAARIKLIAKQRAVIPFIFVSTLGREVIEMLPKDSSVAVVHKIDISAHLRDAVRAVLNGRPYISPCYRD